MAYRFTNTDKWSDSWFYSLNNLEKLLFIYLCDNCDIAGFVELNILKWCSDFRVKESDIKGALKGLQRGLNYSLDGRIIFVRNFIKHQKNQDLNKNNKAHLGIIKRLEDNLSIFGFSDINQYFTIIKQAPTKPLARGTGIGIGNGIDEIKEGVKGEETKIVNLDKIQISEDLKPILVEWLEYKKSRKETYKSEKSLQALANELTRLSNNDQTTARAIIQKSMANNWAGIFALKVESKQQKKGVTIGDLQNIYDEIIYGNENRGDNSTDNNPKMLRGK